MAGGIFINYRRGDSSGTAGRLSDRLVREFGRKSLFMDVDNMPAGVDFVTHVNARVAACDVFLAVIGPNWLDAKNARGQRRLDDPGDHVSIEIAAALERDIRVIPVLIDGAFLPKSDELPQALKPLRRRHAVEVRNAYFGRDAEALAEQVREALRNARPGRRRWPVATSAAIAIVIAASIAVYNFGLPPWIAMPGLPQQGSTRAPTPSTTASPYPLYDALLARMAEYSVSSEVRQINARKFQQGSVHKAIAVSPEAHGTFWSAAWPTADDAETRTLEGCHFRYGAPCVLIATNDKIASDDGSRKTRDMPRVRYAGTFDLRQIPRAREALLNRSDVANYASAPEPKAAALHPEGDPTFVTVAAAASQYDAEEQALAKCNAAPKQSDSACFLYAVGNQVVLPQRSPKPLTPRLLDALLARMTQYSVAASERQNVAERFIAEGAHKALTVSPDTRRAYWSARWPSAAEAETGALEGCQILSGRPCALLAVNDKVSPESESSRAVRDMPRVRYAGKFDPQQIPRARSDFLWRKDVMDYAAAAEPKAVAYHVDGKPTFIIVSAAATQFDAEQQALARCEETSKQLNTPCFLYAVGNQVVLPQRSAKPLTRRPTIAEQLASLSVVPDSAASVAEAYDKATGHKAIAVAAKAHLTWRATSRPSEEAAITSALESCQVFYDEPCTLAIVGYRFQPARGEGHGPRDMPRTRYAGLFDPAQIPAASDELRRRQDVASYRSAAGPKAAAYHPWGLLFTAKAANQFEAEEQALAQCNNDPDRRGRDGSCLLYAVGDKVVLSQRLRKPLSAQLSEPTGKKQ
jgi:TIR domain-containing protein